MSRSSEDVLLIVGAVKHKKTEGTLYMMATRMGWMLSSKDTFNISLNYADIKVQKVSPDSKEKIQLQVCMHDSSATTFHFVNSKGREAQKKDRDSIKEILQQLLPKFKQKISSELEGKNKLLQEDPELFGLYKNLVVSGVITADEFWAQRSERLNNATLNKQDVGVSAAFLADVKPEADGANGLKYNLTSDIIQAVFRTYPAVKQKHAELVPDKLTEQEFWTKFFQSHYFHRDRISISNKDLFSECAKFDEKEIAGELSKPVNDPLTDLTTLSDSTLVEGYGTATSNASTSENAANASLIKRFNLHSTMVLKACEKEPVRNTAPVFNGRPNTPSLSNGDKSETSTQDEDLPARKKVRLKEKMEYNDLSGPSQHTWQAGPSLKICQRDRYLHGPTPLSATQYHTSEEIMSACQAVTQEMLAWRPNLTQVLPSGLAVGVLGELSPGGSLMQSTSQQQLHQMVPECSRQELQQLYNALCELLRHFWSCFPVSNKALEDKACVTEFGVILGHYMEMVGLWGDYNVEILCEQVMRMAASLDRFHQAKLQPFRDKLAAQHFSLDLVGHMEGQLQAAQQKYNSWVMKRTGKKS